MSKHKYTNVVCSLILVFALLLSLLFLNGEKLGITASAATFPYVEKLFDTSKVHTIDIVVDDDDWQEMLSNAMAEEYISCNVVIDGESVRNVGIRPKGNTSLSQVASSDSDRYSFKIEFDHYDSSNSYYGLDKLALNNIIQDNTYLKDYLTYQMMQAARVASPLSSFVYITVNGQDWGLYVAVEGVEESFLERNYGSDYGELYKPDSSSMNDQSNMEDAAQDGFGNRENIPQKPQNQQDSTQTQDSATVAETADTTQDDTQAQEKQTFGGRGGGMGGGMGGGRGNATQQLPQQEEGTDDVQAPADDGSTNDSSQLPQLPSDGAPSGELPSGQLPDGSTLPENGQGGTFPQMGQGQQGMMPFSQQPGSDTQEGQDSQGTLPTQGDTQGEIPSVDDFPSGGQLPIGDDSQSSQSETETDQRRQDSTDSGQTQDGTNQAEGDTSQQQPPTDRDSGAMGQQGQRPGGTAATSTSLNFSTLSLVGGSILLLLLALLLVKKYRR